MSQLEKLIALRNKNKGNALEINSMDGRGLKQQDNEQKDILKTEIKDIKSWQPKGTCGLDRKVKLGTRLRGETQRRPDRPSYKISRSDNPGYAHFDTFEAKFDSKKQYNKNRLEYSSEKEKMSSNVQPKSLTLKPLIPRYSQYNGRNLKQSKNRSKRYEHKKLFLDCKKQAQISFLATKKPAKK